MADDLSATPPFAPDGRGLRLHPCTLGALWAGLALLCAVELGLRTPLLGAVLVVPALIWLASFAHAIAQGHPRVDAHAQGRLRAVLADVAAAEPVQVTVVDQLPIALRVVRGGRPRMLAATSFVAAADDAVLRGAVALGVGELRSEALARRSSRLKAAAVPLGLVIGFGGAVLWPEDLLLAGLASTALAAWLVIVAGAAWTRRSSLARAYASADDAAVALAGDAGAVRGALEAMAAWRAADEARKGRSERLLARCQHPLAPDWHEAERAARLAC